MFHALSRAFLTAFLALAGACVACVAAEVEHLYESEVPVSSKEQGDRELGLANALHDVLVKVTGNRDARSFPGIAEAIRSPRQYVQQFEFRTESVATLSSDGSASQLMLWARFDPEAVDRLVLGSGLPVWGKTRPSVLLWLAMESDGGRGLIGADDSPAIAQVLGSATTRRGIPIVVPLLDLEDRSQLEVSDVWVGAEERIRAASRRYAADLILTAVAAPSGADAWETRWRLYTEQFPHEWVTRAEGLDTALDEGIDWAADFLASRFATSPAEASEKGVALTITDVRSLADYARALRYLQGLDGVTRVDPTGVDAQSVSFYLEARGGGPVLRQVIALGRTLNPTASGESMTYQLLR